MSTLTVRAALPQIASLWDVLKLQASAFYWATAWSLQLEGIHIALKERENSGKNDLVSDANLQDSIENAHRLREQLALLGAQMTLMAVDRLIGALQLGTIKYGEFGDALEVINVRMKDELTLVTLFVLGEGKNRYLAPATELFSAEVADAFPSAIPDIEAAGKSIAYEQGTAAVFHCMRAMEVALKALARVLGIPYAPSWESYISQITTRISAKHKTKGIKWKRDEAYYRDLCGDLHAVKLVWRNPTMHVVRRYSPEEAEEIFRAVRGFMKRLAERNRE